MPSLVVSAHQPHFLPWLGYLEKIARSDVFVVMDDLQFEAQNFQNRNRVKVNNGVAWLTVPLIHGPQDERVLDKLIAYPTGDRATNREHWQRRSWLTLLTHYRRAPHFPRYADELEDLFLTRWDRLLDLDMHVLKLLMRWFDIPRTVLLASSLSLQGQRTDRIVDLCRRVGASTYLSGSGASRDYLDVAEFQRIGVDVAWQSFRHPTYVQRYPARGFVPNLAAIDLLFNCGPDSRGILLGEQKGPGSEAVVATVSL